MSIDGGSERVSVFTELSRKVIDDLHGLLADGRA